MYKIAILGCENSHAATFLRLIQGGAYPEIEVAGVYSEDMSAAEKLNKDFGVQIMPSSDSLAGKTDGIMITARHGDNHLKYARAYLPYGIPMFIDKPITISVKEADELVETAKKYGVRLCGGSTCGYVAEAEYLASLVKSEKLGEIVGGSLLCPFDPESVYGGFYFYAQHLVQIMLKVFGTDIKYVNATAQERAVSVIAGYGGFDVTCSYVENEYYYYISVFGKKTAESKFLTVNEQSFCHELNEMRDLLKGGAMRQSYEEFILPVKIMAAIERSYTERKIVHIAEV